MRQTNKQEHRKKRQARVRAKIFGTAEKPRLNVWRGLRGLYVQLVDDAAGKTLASVYSKNIAIKSVAVGERKGKVAAAYLAGKTLAEKAKIAGIVKVIFDRAGYKYHGRVAAVAEGARDGGLQF